MKNTIFKSILALLAGFVFVVILSTASDYLLEKIGIMQQPFDHNTGWFIVLVILYRNIFSTIGSYITARLAPNQPMRHAMIGGFMGLIISMIGAIVMWHVPPHWYAVSLIILALPSAWLGGKIWMNQLKK